MDIEQLRAAVGNAGPREPGRRFSPELRRRLIGATHRLWASGEALADIADALGIHVQMATRYLDVPIETDDDEDEEVAELPAAGLVLMDPARRGHRRQGPSDHAGRLRGRRSRHRRGRRVVPRAPMIGTSRVVKVWS